MESINVVIDDEEVGASSKGEEIQPIPTELLMSAKYCIFGPLM
jgi:hypothetical protein